MSPVERQEFNDMKKRLSALERAENVSFVESVFRRIESNITDKLKRTSLNIFSDVDMSGITNGQILKYNSTTEKLEAANDETA